MGAFTTFLSIYIIKKMDPYNKNFIYTRLALVSTIFTQYKTIIIPNS